MISIVSPIFRAPFFRAPPRIPPWRFFMFVPGLLMSKLRAIRKSGFSDGSGFVIFILISSSRILSRLISCRAETGMIGASSAIVPLTNSLIALWLAIACSFETRSILFWTMIIFWIFLL